MKKKIICLTLYLTSFMGSNAYAVEIATQDLFVIDALRIKSAGGELDFTPTLISASLSSAGPKVDFPGGAAFAPTTAFPGKVIDGNGSILSNTVVTPGVLSFNDHQSFSLLTSSDLAITRQTVGINESIAIDVTRFAPGVKKGDVGTIDFSLYQFLPSLDRSKENGLSPVEIAALRVKDNRAQFPSLDGALPVLAKNFPLQVGGGSVNWFFVGKALVAVGTAGSFALAGATVGPWGLAGGAIAGAAVGVGGILVANAFEPPALLVIIPGLIGLAWRLGRRLRMTHSYPGLVQQLCHTKLTALP